MLELAIRRELRRVRDAADAIEAAVDGGPAGSLGALPLARALLDVQPLADELVEVEDRLSGALEVVEGD